MKLIGLCKLLTKFKSFNFNWIFHKALKMQTFIKAVAFAANKDKKQRRKDVDASPYINHPIALADVLANEGGIVDVNVLCAAVLHDTVEDTKTTEQELIDSFGAKIASIVMEVTDDKNLDKFNDFKKHNPNFTYVSFVDKDNNNDFTKFITELKNQINTF